MKRLVRWVWLIALVGTGTAQRVVLPFVGCRSDGQTGPLRAPRGHAPTLRISREAAAKLAWYQAEEAPGVVGPSGWHCFGTYGSSGATLYVSPEPITSKMLFGDAWKGFRGAAIEISSMDGGTSGRFHVARTIARLFPAHIDFTKAVIAEALEPAGNFPMGPFPADKLTYKTRTLVEFVTPPGKDGLGTSSRLLPGSEAIRGFVFLSMEPDDDAYDVSLQVRLPAEPGGLVDAILAGTEQVVRTKRAP